MPVEAAGSARAEVTVAGGGRAAALPREVARARLLEAERLLEAARRAMAGPGGAVARAREVGKARGAAPQGAARDAARG